jgi:cyclohexanone monooxygenase
VYQPQVLEYLQHVVKRHDLRKDIQLNTELLSAQWDEEKSRWEIKTSNDETFKARYLVTALGLLSRQNFPNIKGRTSFRGEMYHTGAWPADADMEGKRVGVIGNGSTGVQVITALGGKAKQLLCFQRNPQFSVPSGDRPVEAEYRKKVNEDYEQIWQKAKGSTFAFGFEESDVPTMSVSKEERERIFQSAWEKGGGFRFMFGTFCDISYDEKANKEAADFIKRKIQTIVTDPEKARKLTPTQFYARRPLCDAGYYQQFNRENVDIIDINATPVEEFTPTGIKTSNGHVHELDVVIFATGFDAVDGNYTRVAIKGRTGQTLKEHWAEGPTSYLGVSVPDFPNLFMITGPNGPFTNIPPTIETHVEFISDVIATAEKKSKPETLMNGSAQTNGDTEHCLNGLRRGPIIEATSQAEEAWTTLCDELSANSLFRKTDSWIFGANVPGKKNSVLFYFGGLGNYRKKLREVVDAGYEGYKPF